MIFYACDYDGLTFRNIANGEFTYRELTQEDHQAFAVFLAIQRDSENVFAPIYDIAGAFERLDNGEYCLLCEDHGEIVGYIWFATNKKFIVELQAILYLAKNEVYSYNAYVRKSHRGRNILAAIRDIARLKLIERGYKREITARMDWNESSRKTIIKSGFEEIGNVTAGSLLTFRYMMNSCKDITLVNMSSPLEFYVKLWGHMKASLA